MHIRKLLLREMKQFAQGHPSSKWQVLVGPKPCPRLHANPPPLRWLVIVEVAPGARAQKLEPQRLENMGRAGGGGTWQVAPGTLGRPVRGLLAAS